MCVLDGEGLACEDTAPGWLPALKTEHETVCVLKTHFPTLWDFPLSLFSAEQHIIANRCSFGPFSQGTEINVMFEHVCFPTHCWSFSLKSAESRAWADTVSAITSKLELESVPESLAGAMACVCRVGKQLQWVISGILLHCGRIFLSSPFNPFRYLSAGSCAHPWDCCLQETLAHCPEPGVRMLVQHCAAFSLLLQCHHPPDCASCAWEYFYSCPSPSFGSLFFVFFPQCFSCQWKFFSSPFFPWGWLVYLWIHCCASSRGEKATLGQPHCWLCCSTGHTVNLESCSNGNIPWNNSLPWSHMPSPSLGPQTPRWIWGLAGGQQLPANVPQEPSKPFCLT